MNIMRLVGIINGLLEHHGENMMEIIDLGYYWPYIVSALCGALMFAVIRALIVNESFRKDLAASEGKANLFNQISIEGALVLVLCCLLFYGLIFPVINPYIPLKTIAQVNGLEMETPSELVQLVIKLKKTTSEDKKELSIMREEKLAIKNGLINYVKISDIPEFIKNLSPKHSISDEIFSYPTKEVGPWSKFSKSKVITVSIPSKLIPKGKALSCQEYYDENYELFSAIEFEGEKITGNTVTVNTHGLIYRSSDCNKKVTYQMQISCVDAEDLFTKRVITCDKNGEALWTDQKPNKLLVNIVPVPKQ